MFEDIKKIFKNVIHGLTSKSTPHTITLPTFGNGFV
jgi:hypothetical protein